MVTSPDAAQTQADEMTEREANSWKAAEGSTAATNHLATDAIHRASNDVTERRLQTKTSTHRESNVLFERKWLQPKHCMQRISTALMKTPSKETDKTLSILQKTLKNAQHIV